MISPLSTVVEVLKKVSTDAKLYGSKLAKNEAATRSALIDPILRVLGWDLSNPFAVEFERTFLDTRVDYALINSQEQVKVIIEAKTLGGKLDDKKIIMSVLTYAFTYGLQDIFLTDGVVWEHFYDFAPGKVSANRTLDLSKDDLVDCAEYFVNRLDYSKYWPDTFETESKSVLSKTEKQIKELSKELISIQAELLVIEKSIEPLVLSYQSAKLSTGVENKISDTEFVELEKLPKRLTNMKPPIFLRLPDGSIVPISNWSDIISECCIFVMKNYSGLPIPLPDRAGKTVNLISFEKTSTSKRFLETKYNDKTVYVQKNYASNNCVSNALYILGFLPSEYKKVKPAVSGFME